MAQSIICKDRILFYRLRGKHKEKGATKTAAPSCFDNCYRGFLLLSAKLKETI